MCKKAVNNSNKLVLKTLMFLYVFQPDRFFFVPFVLIYLETLKKSSAHIWRFSNFSEIKLRNIPSNKWNCDLYYRDNVNGWTVSSWQIKVTWYVWPCACHDGIREAVWCGWRYNSIIPLILNLGIRWRWVVSWTPQLLHNGENKSRWTYD
jgi:hypothetical protein